MNKVLFFSLLLLFCIDAYSQDGNKNDILIHSRKGYLFFVTGNYGEVIFFPAKKVVQKFHPRKLNKITGLQLRGQDIYPVYKAKQDANNYIVKMHYQDFDRDSNYYVATEIRIIPVELLYKSIIPKFRIEIQG